MKLLDERLGGVLARARETHDSKHCAVEKTMWGSPAGKKRLATRLAAMLPPHKTYVEPFVGSGAVLFAKEPAAREIVNDADPDIAEAYRIVKRLTPEKMKALRGMKWTGDRATYQSLLKSKPAGDAARLHRFMYLSHFGFRKMRGSFSPAAQGIEARALARIEKHAPRLKGVQVFSEDYEKLVRKFDGKDTVFFLDPPYAGYDVGVGEKKFDEERFLQVLKGIRGKFLVTYGVRGKLPKLVKDTKFTVKRIKAPRTLGTEAGHLTQLLIANYDPVAKADVPETWFVQQPAPAASAADRTPFSFQARLLKADRPDEERFVLGVVLEPDTVDSQGDTYTAEEVRQAAHVFMEEFGSIGLMHRMKLGDDVKVLESYIAPEDVDVGGSQVKKGTWLLGVRVLSDRLWKMVKAGELTGFSIGGDARRIPVDEADAA